MKITFIGKQEKLNPTQERKLATAFARLSKLVERKGEKAALVTLSSERHRQIAEVRVNFFDHPLVGEGVATDQFQATMAAVENVEKQAQKGREKWRLAKRDTPARKARTTGEPIPEAPLPDVPKPAKAATKKNRNHKPAAIVRASRDNGKPMTIDEAMLALGPGQDYMVYRDSGTDRMNILIRRRDGKIDLVEA
jgi:ribosome-associated translation inhibitor RaiA